MTSNSKELIERCEEALTPSGETKAAYMGEFSFPVTLNEGTDDEDVLRVQVPWATIKEIMAAIKARATQSPVDEGGR